MKHRGARSGFKLQATFLEQSLPSTPGDVATLRDKLVMSVTPSLRTHVPVMLGFNEPFVFPSWYCFQVY